jgi:hypothetical protein
MTGDNKEKRNKNEFEIKSDIDSKCSLVIFS